jgi:hypothetical protein
VLLGDGTGALLPATEYEAGVGQGPSGLVRAHLDDDEHLDAATVNVLSATVSVLPGDGEGSFGVAQSCAAGAEPNAIAAADFDGDGDTDLAVTSSGTDELVVLLGDGRGAFVAGRPILVHSLPFSSPPFIAPGGIVAADLDLDGRPDLLALANVSTQQVVDVRLNLGPPPFPRRGSTCAARWRAPWGRRSSRGWAAGAPGALHVEPVAAFAPALLCVSVGSAPQPFKGGLQAFPPLIALPLATGAGTLHLPLTWPAGVPAGTLLIFQCAVQDGAAIQGVALSNGLAALTP